MWIHAKWIVSIDKDNQEGRPQVEQLQTHVWGSRDCDFKKGHFLWWCPMDECEATGEKKAKSKDSDGMPSAITDAKT